ncbi:MAG: alanine dehydrogenase [Flavobacteriales bacterium]|nr:alanine dehydrogenase [Flavobacteriales bacterium]
MKIGIIREGKIPPDKRVPFTPTQCRNLMDRYPQLDLVVQPSEIRAFKDSAYQAQGIQLQEDMSDREVLFGVKEVPIEMLIPDKRYFFFSHTYKEQPYNRKLLQAILDKRIQLIDYELLKDSKGDRIIGFGRWAGIVGAYSGFRGWGMLNDSFHIKAAHACEDMQEMLGELKKVSLPDHFKLVVTGTGRVGKGAHEIIRALDIQQIEPEAFLDYSDPTPVYTILDAEDYNRHAEGRSWDKSHFYAHPEEYEGTFLRFAKSADMYIPCHYWDSNAPLILSEEDLRDPDLRLQIISDVSMDIKEPIASTVRPSVIGDAYYGYDPQAAEEVPFGTPGSIGVQAVDNLPCELPKDASQDFGQALMDKVIPCLLGDDPDRIIERASQTDLHGNLMPDFMYLSDYLKG